MKKIVLISLLLVTPTFAGLPPTSLKGQSGSKVTTFNFETPHSQATTISGPTRLIETGNQNLLANPGGEGGTTGFAETGAGTLASETTAANVGTGAKSISFDATAATTDYLSSTAVAIPPGMYGKNGLIQLYTKGTSGETITLQAHDGTNILATATITQSGTFQVEQLNFAFPSSGNIELRLVGTGNTAIMYFDDFYLGPAINLSNVSQASFIGSAYFATTANCAFTRTNTALGAMTDTDCPGPTVELNPGPGVIQTTDADAPKVTVNSLPPGTYEVIFTGPTIIGTGVVPSAMSISDGTTQSGQTGSHGGVSNDAPFALVGHFTYTTSGNRSFEIFASTTSNNIDIPLMTGNRRLTFSIKRFPTSSELAVKPDQTPASWSGYHDNDCTFSLSNPAFADFGTDASCTFTERTNRNFGTVTSYLSGGNKTSGIIFTPTKAGRYNVCAVTAVKNDGGSGTTLRLTDGNAVVIGGIVGNNAATNVYAPSTLCGIADVASAGAAFTVKIQGGNPANSIFLGAATSLSSSIEWSIFQLDAPMPAPILVNSILSNGTGPFRMEGANVTATCSSNPCTIAWQSGAWLSSITWNSTGNYTANIATSMFTTAPACNITASENVILDSVSTSAIAFRTFNNAASLSDAKIHIQCMGAR